MEKSEHDKLIDERWDDYCEALVLVGDRAMEWNKSGDTVVNTEAGNQLRKAVRRLEELNIETEE